jgi:hypothetical protein
LDTGATGRVRDLASRTVVIRQALTTSHGSTPPTPESPNRSSATGQRVGLRLPDDAGITRGTPFRALDSVPIELC